MTDQPPSQQPANEQGATTPALTPQPPAATGGQTADGPVPVPPAEPGGAVAGFSGSPFPADRPEIAVGAAFAGGLVLALILKRLGR